MSADDLDYTRPTRSDKKQSAALEGVNGAVGIRNGAQCANFLVDQNTVMFLLNSIPSTSGGSLFPTGPTLFKAARNGFCDPALSEAIRRFQQANGLKAGGVVDPGVPTSARLRALAHAPHPDSAGRGDEGLIQDIDTLAGVLLITAGKMSGSTEGAQFSAMSLEIQRSMAQSGITPQVTLQRGVIGGTLFENLAQIEALGTLLDALISGAIVGGLSGATGTLTEATLRPIRGTIRRALDLARRVRSNASGAVVEALGKMAQLAGQTKGACGPEVQVLLFQTSFLTSLLMQRTSSDPRGLARNIAGASREWLSAFSAAVLCLDDGGIPLLGAARAAFAGGMTLIGLLQQFLGAGELPQLART